MKIKLIYINLRFPEKSGGWAIVDWPFVPRKGEFLIIPDSERVDPQVMRRFRVESVEYVLNGELRSFAADLIKVFVKWVSDGPVKDD